jgi:4-methylaminobutanoate oxidase (formaldehyde-forming)
MALAHCIVNGRTPNDLPEADPKRFPDCWNSVEALSARVPEILGSHYELSHPGRQMTTARHLRTSPLANEWRAAKGHLGQVYGWERPLYFGAEGVPELGFGRPAWFDAVGAEVRAAHEQAATFDQSTFGKILVEGPDAEALLNRVCANDMGREPGHVVYTAMLNQDGGFESDLTALRLGPERYRLYVGTSAVKRDLAWLRRHMKDGERVTLRDETEVYAVLALMGPKAPAIAADLGARDLDEIAYFRHGEAEIGGVPVRAARLSYIGEAGWELTCRAGDAPKLFAALHEAGARPAGLYAQTAMRIEKRFLAMGADLDGDTTPIEAGTTFAVAWETDFIGREALLRRRDAGAKSTMVTMVFEGPAAVPLGNEPIYQDGRIVGLTTSAAYGYRVGKPLALGYVGASGSGDLDGSTVEIDIAGRRYAATVSLAAVFDPEGRRMRAEVEKRRNPS